MKRLIRLLIGVMVPAFVMAGFGVQPAVAQDKAKDAKAAPAAKAEKGKPTTKVLLDNDKVRVTEVTFKPGDVGADVERPFRVNRVLKGGTMQRIYADGKTEKVEYKTGEVKGQGPDKAFAPKNIGKSDVVFYIVIPKQAK